MINSSAIEQIFRLSFYVSFFLKDSHALIIFGKISDKKIRFGYFQQQIFAFLPLYKFLAVEESKR